MAQPPPPYETQPYPPPAGAAMPPDNKGFPPQGQRMYRHKSIEINGRHFGYDKGNRNNFFEFTNDRCNRNIVRL